MYDHIHAFVDTDCMYMYMRFTVFCAFSTKSYAITRFSVLIIKHALNENAKSRMAFYLQVRISQKKS